MARVGQAPVSWMTELDTISDFINAHMTLGETGVLLFVFLFLYDRYRVRSYYAPVTAVEV